MTVRHCAIPLVTLVALVVVTAAAVGQPAGRGSDPQGDRRGDRPGYPTDRHGRPFHRPGAGDPGQLPVGPPHRPGYGPQPRYESHWLQRPYPYHLDYYRMRYGGSYAPYFGNLYGPPNLYTAPYAFPGPAPFPHSFGGAYYW